MTGKRTARTLIGLLLAVLLIFPLVLGVGFANPPKNREVQFLPGESFEIPIYVVGADSIKVSVNSPDKGDPETLGTPEDNNILAHTRIDDPAPLIGQRRVMLVFDFPESMAPGVYSVDVTSAEVSPGDAGIIARAAMKMRFTVRVLSDEKLLEITRVRANAVPEGLDTTATVEVISRTTSHIDNARAKVFVHDGDEVVTVVEVDGVSLASSEKHVFIADLPVAHLSGGAFKVNATVFYDGKEALGPSATLSIGTLHVDITQYSRELIYNATNKFRFKVDNLWNREIRNVEAVVSLGEQTKQTARQSIPAFKKSNFYEIYFDRDASVKPGQETVNITVNYQDYDPDFDSYLSASDTFPLPVDVIIPVVEETPTPISTSMIVMYSLLGLLVLLLAAVLLVLLKRRKSPPEHHEEIS